MRHRPRIADLFCGAGGAGVGLHRAGFEVVGFDIDPQPRYPFEFHQLDALTVDLSGFHAVWASPPCQAYSALRCLPWLKDNIYWDSVPPTRDYLASSGKPWVMENVMRAPMPDSVYLCGQMFGLPTFRHRRFECSPDVMLLQPGHEKHREVIGHGRMVNDRMKGTLNAGSAKGAWGTKQPIVTVAGGQFLKRDGERALGIDWMLTAELAQAIPPAYSQFLGEQLIKYVKVSV